MELIEVGPDSNTHRREFFEKIFGDNKGYIGVLALKHGDKKKATDAFYLYPDKLDGLLEWINKNYHSKSLYFCPQLLGARKRVKENVISCPVIWSDLDECDPEILVPEPSIVVRTSEGRHHAYWLLDEPADPFSAEDAAHRIAYKYESFGADKSGWDLSQLLRIPLTYNTKYDATNGVFPIIEVVKDEDLRYSIAEFEKLEGVPGLVFEETPFPKELLKKRASTVLNKYKDVLDPKVIELYREEPADDWSSALWHLEMLLFEHDIPKEDVFVICWNAKCNKYARDKRPPEALWRDVCKADVRVSGVPIEEAPALPDLMTDDERKKLRGYKTFVDRYVEWAESLGDAASQYHEVGALMILSALLAGTIKLQTSHGVITPNLWVMILADTTLTRKSTAMSQAMNMIREVEEEAILATDGSLEGLMTAIASRPGRPGIFWRDEFSGLLEAMKRKDYYAGMAEALTKLYDGEYQKRILRKETIELKNPILLIFCGGIRSRIFELMEYEHVISGFAPRFIFVEAEADIDKFKPVGPLSQKQDEIHDKLVQELAEMKDLYHSDMTLHIAGQTIGAPQVWDIELTPKAWDRYNQLQKEMISFGLESMNREIYIPTMDRLATSALKCACLMAASRQDPNKKDKVIVDLPDLLKAISYVERWRDYSIDVLENAGKTTTEKRMEQVLRAIKSHGEGVTRSKIMQNCRLSAREADQVLETLSQRALIQRKRFGRTEQIHAL